MKARHEFPNEKEWLEYLRTHFAAMAMQGLTGLSYDAPTSSWNMSPEDLAKNAILFADALIEQLNKPTPL